MSILFFVLVAVAVIAGAIISARLKRQREEAMESYAAAQGWQPLLPDAGTLMPLLPEVLQANPGNAQRYDMAYGLKLAGIEAAVFEYEYDVRRIEYDSQGMPVERTQTFSFGILTFKVPQVFMPVFVRHHSIFGGLSSNICTEKLDLEGDFNQHFDTFTTSGKEVEALSLLTPDVMALIEDAGEGLNVQATGHNVTIFGSAGLINPQKIAPLLSYGQQLAARLSAKPVEPTAAAQ